MSVDVNSRDAQNTSIAKSHLVLKVTGLSMKS